MRRNPTPAERRLWQALRNYQIDGYKIRRQVPLGPFIADFYCPAARLAIELDGWTHMDPVSDARRDRWMYAQGIRVLRLWNNDVMDNLDGALATIRHALQHPARQGWESDDGR